MPSKPAVELHFEQLPESERRAFHVSLYPIFEEDEKKQGLTIPPYNYRTISVAAKATDGSLVGGLRGDTAWNELHIVAVAANPAHRFPGTGTALLKYAEELARTKLDCNRLRIEVFSWQPKALFESFGYEVFGVQGDHPEGHTKYFLQKVWSVESKHEPVQGYDKAAAGLVFDTWDETASRETIKEWIDADTEARTAALAHPVRCVVAPPLFAIRATFPDGAPAAGVVCLVVWNELHINLLAVAPTAQRRGIGSAVMAKLDAVAREHQCAYIVLETSSWQGRPFYEKNGFAVFSTQYDVPNGFQRYRLSRTVPPPC